MRPTQLEDEVALVEAFFVKEKRARVIQKISGSRRKRDTELREHLPHESRWDRTYVVPLMPAAQTVDGVADEMARRGAKMDSPVYILSANRALDARVCPLREALRDVVGSSSGSVISCLRGRLAYYEGEEPGNRFILFRSPTRQ